MAESLPLNILAVEDSADDIELIRRTLRSAGYDPSMTQVDTADTMDGALGSTIWDIILADYRLPSFSGIEAIALARSKNLDIPVIVVSGTIGEEAAVEAMRAGADDYVLKASLERLPEVVRRQLSEADRQQRWRSAEIARRSSDQQQELEKQQLSDSLSMLTRGILYIAERLEDDPPRSERADLLRALRESATAARRQLASE